MFFLSEDERRYLFRRLLPEARTIGVHEEFRGWSWAGIDQPLRPTYSPLLDVPEVASSRCESGRDVYVRRVLGEGWIDGEGPLRQAALAWVEGAKRVLYSAPLSGELVADLPRLLVPDRRLFGRSCRREVVALWRFETVRLAAAVQDVLSRHPDIGVDGLVAQVLPVIVSPRVDGQFLGLSRDSSIDAFLFEQGMVLRLSFGSRHESDRLITTGYALALESVYEAPVNLGCVAYVEVRGDHVAIERDFHFIDDELRARFIEERDRKQRLVQEELDPGLPAACWPACPHLAFCAPALASMSVAGPRTGRAAARRRPVSANRPPDMPAVDYVAPHAGPIGAG